MISSILAGYAWDTNNPYVADDQWSAAGRAGGIVHGLKYLALLLPRVAGRLCQHPHARPHAAAAPGSPPSLGRELAVVQQLLTVRLRARARAGRALEADAQSGAHGRSAAGPDRARLEWDGRQLEQSLAPGWPRWSARARAGDLQLVWWPAEAVRAALAPGGSWSSRRKRA
jgi:hypothetical protein